MEVLVALAGLVGSVLEFLIGVRAPAHSTAAASQPEAEKRVRWRRYCPQSPASTRLNSERLWDEMPGEFRLLTGNPSAIKQVLSTCGACLTGRARVAPATPTVPQATASPLAPPAAAMRCASPRSMASRAFWDALATATLTAVVAGALALLPRVAPLAPLTGVEILLAVGVVALVSLTLRALIRRACRPGPGTPDPRA
ncbi:hypothetical protein [Pandoraea oxalativorans]|uniref:Uncharacterized protein n=1 Tax=Pandoraea oxalativorans TaxID=573737 RepID=A0A0G3IBZ0_9BURK|nr:hypothetical protein [Pandoraea oxalativorans]AKK24772.1 hypothetical protein MB84_28660 [Pandoraea oxalativorans]